MQCVTCLCCNDDTKVIIDTDFSAVTGEGQVHDTSDCKCRLPEMEKKGNGDMTFDV